MSTAPWVTPEIIQHTQRLITSFQHWTGRSLLASITVEPADSVTDQMPAPDPAKALFFAPFVVVSHGTQANPIFNYGNQSALDLWEFDWAAFTQLPSRESAAPMERDARAELLADAKAQGYISNYQGIRQSRTGQRFWIEQVILWDVLTETGENCGQAATFAHWTFL